MLKLVQTDFMLEIQEVILQTNKPMIPLDDNLVGVKYTSTGRSLMIYTDFDYPAIAGDFGWIPCPFCQSTDGTVDCKHRNTSAMIQSAEHFLYNHIGEIAEDPGYF